MNKRILLLLLLTSIFFQASFAQTPSEFSSSKNEFVKEVGGFMNATKREDVKETVAIFEDFLLEGNITDSQFKKIQEVANNMAKKKMRAYPHFEHYLRSLNKITQSGQSADKFDSYISVVEQILNNLKPGRYNPYVNFLKFTFGLFDENALFYSSGGSTKWISTSNKYQFAFKDKMPLVKFPELELKGIRKQDSVTIKKTSGEYFPSEYTWKGTTGEVHWARSGSSQDAYVTFEDYTIEVKKSGYEVKKALLYYPIYFEKPIEGNFKDKIIVGNNATSNTYPRFESFTKRMDIENIGQGIKYSGGFRLYGRDVIGFGDKENKAVIQFYNRGGELAVSAISESFIIRKGEKIVSDGAAASMFFENDSLFHPNVRFKFNIPERKLTLTRGENGSAKTPFFDSHHKFDIEAENVSWSIDSTKIDVGSPGPTSISNDMILESLNYFNDKKYQRYQAISTTHPIAQIRAYCEQLGSREVHGEDLATRMNRNYDLTSILSLLNTLVEDGFVYFDPDTKMVTAKDKVFSWADASVEKVDFDVIRIRSEGSSKKANGIINITDNSLALQGVKNVIISDSQLVVIKPSDKNLTLKKNRNMEFDGQLYAGFGIFKGQGFKFNYRRFGMDLDSIQSFLIRIKAGEDADGTPLIQPLLTKIEGLTGSIQIDAPGNKSSRENIPEFPSFESTEKSKTFYQDRKIRNNAYKRENFFFELDPFNFDSLDSFDPEYLAFEGEMNSADIFPKFKEKLKVQKEDLSLGFKTTSPPEGYNLYNKEGTNKGRFTNEISLSHNGLIGSGTVNYINSEMSSEEIIFLPDRMKAPAKTFNITEQRTGTEFPEVNAIDVEVDWEPYTDSMYIKSDGVPFEFFDGEKKLEGSLVLTPGGLYGNGVLDWKEATLTSNLLLFKSRGVNADTANLSIKALDTDAELAFNTKNVKTSLDFENGIGTFESNNKKDANTTMPYNQYKTSLDKFSWNMNQKTIEFESSTGAGGSFLSIRPDQDSLNFTATKANYDLTTNILNIEGVPFIYVADAIVYPGDGKVTVQAQAKMDMLTDAKIVANTENKYHTINRANVQIKGKKNYKASGFYEYNIGNKEQEIRFSDIVVRKTKSKKYVTKASGKLLDSDEFFVDEKIGFKGDVLLSANSKNLIFDGFARINTPLLQKTNWFSINSKVDKKNVFLTYDEPKNPNGLKIHTGLLLNQDSSVIYSAVQAAPRFRKDQKIYTAKGVMWHDKMNKYFHFGDSAKIFLNNRRGNKLTFDERDGKITAEGTFIFDNGFKGYATMLSAGRATTLANSYDVNFNLIAGINLPLPEKMLNIIADDLYAFGAELPDVDMTGEHVPNALAEFIEDDRKLDKLVEGIDGDLGFALPKEIVYSFFFNKLDMRWDSDILSFVSSSQTGISTINGKPVEKMVKCYVDIQKIKGQKDILSIYIESPSDDWYYLTFQENLLLTISSNGLYNDIVLNSKRKDLKFKMEDGVEVEVDLSSVNSVNFFKSRMRNVGGASIPPSSGDPDPSGIPDDAAPDSPDTTPDSPDAIPDGSQTNPDPREAIPGSRPDGGGQADPDNPRDAIPGSSRPSGGGQADPDNPRDAIPGSSPSPKPEEKLEETVEEPTPDEVLEEAMEEPTPEVPEEAIEEPTPEVPEEAIEEPTPEETPEEAMEEPTPEETPEEAMEEPTPEDVPDDSATDEGIEDLAPIDFGDEKPEVDPEEGGGKKKKKKKGDPE